MPAQVPCWATPCPEARSNYCFFNQPSLLKGTQNRSTPSQLCHLHWGTTRGNPSTQGCALPSSMSFQEGVKVELHGFSLTHTFSFPSVSSRQRIIPNPTSGHQFILVGEGTRVNSKVLYPYPMSNLMGKSKQEMLKHWLNSKF